MNRLTLLSNQITKDSSKVLLEVRGNVGVIYLNSLKTLNALN